MKDELPKPLPWKLKVRYYCVAALALVAALLWLCGCVSGDALTMALSACVTVANSP